MQDIKRESDDISNYFVNQEYTANTYVMKCFTVTMLIYTIALLLNTLEVFVIDQKLMWTGYIPSLLIYLVTYVVSKRVSLSNEKIKRFILFSVVCVFSIMGVFITYHVVLVSLLPFLCATLYSSKKIMRYVYVLSVISTIIIVYGGYFFGLCDANMVLFTSKSMQEYVSDGQFILTEVSDNPYFQLMLFFVVPRCLIYIAYAYVCSNLIKIVSGSLERAKLTVELEKAKEAAENANKAKTQFLARMSHEIRTPINAVLGMDEMILRESTESDIKQYAGDIKNSANSLLNLINEILDSSKIESGKIEIVSVEYEVGSLLNDLYNMVSIRAKDKGLDLIFDVDSNIPSVCLGDDKRLKQVLINLLSNAVKYTNKGTVILKVTAGIEGENAILHYSVKDTGIGIKEEDIGKIYDAFQRVDVSRNRYVEGTGLGLNIASQFLILMGSELHIKSEYEKGSEFSFDISQKIVNPKPLGDFKRRLNQASEQKNYRIDFTAPDAKILVVDDNKINLKVFKGLLKHTQMQVYEAESGKECMDMLREQSFDLIFLDHMMPEMDGVETLHAMHYERLCEDTPVIMLTANAIVGEKEKYISEGFDDYLSKPIIPDRLDKMILHYLPENLVDMGDSDDAKREAENEDDVQKKDRLQSEADYEFKGDCELKTDYEPEIDFQAGINNTGSEELLHTLLGDFYSMIDEKVEKIQLYMSEERIKDYTVEVHGLKSSAKIIGAVALSDEFYQLELLGHAEDKELIEKKTPAVLEHLKKYKLILKKYAESA